MVGLTETTTTWNRNLIRFNMNKEELKKALEALEIADTKLYESNECSVRLYNEVSDYMGIAIEILLGSLSTPDHYEETQVNNK